MKTTMRAVLVGILFLMFGGGGGKDYTSHLSGALRLSGRFGQAYACPIAPRLALSAGHVSSPDAGNAGDTRRGLPYRYEAINGQSGRVVSVGENGLADLALFAPLGEDFRQFYEIAKECPTPGAKVLLAGYELKDMKHYGEPRGVEVTITSIAAGQMVYGGSPGPGSSGACVLNAQDEVVAINFGAPMDYTTGGPLPLGLGVMVCGDWQADTVLQEAPPE